MAPDSVIEEWKKTDTESRKAAEEKMRGDWDAWMTEHKDMFSGMTAGIGKTKKITTEGVSDIANDIMLYSVVEAESHEAAAQIFEHHPHLGIPQASIEVMEMNPL